ncbi:MAG: type II CAAX prenyl endopeptidase Rce1 family protein [Vulcanimicrobiota bacterium]
MENDKTETKKEKTESWYKKARNYRAEIIVSCSTTFILGGLWYQRLGYRGLGKIPSLFKGYPQARAFFMEASHAPIPQLLFFLILPIITLILLKEPITKYGFKIGDWKKGLLYAALSVGLLAPFLYWASTMDEFNRYYQQRLDVGLGWLVIQYGFYMLSWEFLLRGYLYFSLEEKTEDPVFAICLQSVPFAIAHLGKPALEALTCYFGGLVLGYISWKTRSFIYAFLIHWAIYCTLLLFIFLKQ